MLIEYLSLIIAVGLVLTIFYLLRSQREILAQLNRNVRPPDNANNCQTIASVSTTDHVSSPQNLSNDKVQTLNEPTGNSSIAECNDQQVEKIAQTGNQISCKEDNKAQVAKPGYRIFSYLPTIPLFKTKKTETTIQNENREKVKIKLRNNLLKHSVILASTELEDFVIYKLQLHQISRNTKTRIQKFEFGKSKLGSYAKNEKVIMILGATGSGKTTLINSMINYVFGIQFEDKYRFKLVTEDSDGGGNQAFSQTSYITAYTIHHQKGFKVDHTLTIIDTPGFGDTRGIERDAEITKQIHDFFTITGNEGIDHIDAVGFVAQSSLPRLTFTQRYIFDQILALFGKDLGENIYLLLTFADGKTPQVLNGMKEANLPYQEHFKFNNSVIFDNNSTEDEFGLMFWQMGMKSFTKFFSHFSTIKPKSLTQTKSVLEERERIETQIVGLHHEIQLGLNKLEQLKKEVEVVEDHKAQIARNEDFKYTVPEDCIVKHDLDPNTYVTNCLVCNFSCHYPCGIADDGEKYGCAAMDRGGKENAKCTICNNRCSWHEHKNMRYYFTTERREVTKTSEELKQRYLDANGKVKSAKKIIEAMVDEFEAVQLKVVGITEILRKSINKLNEIALKPNPLSTGEYIGILIESEKANAEPGFQDRINHLNEVKKKVEHLANVTEQGYDPFEVYKRKIKQEKDEKAGVWSAVGIYLNKIGFM